MTHGGFDRGPSRSRNAHPPLGRGHTAPKQLRPHPVVPAVSAANTD
jgi:hypothetical protein